MRVSIFDVISLSVRKKEQTKIVKATAAIVVSQLLTVVSGMYARDVDPILTNAPT